MAFKSALQLWLEWIFDEKTSEREVFLTVLGLGVFSLVVLVAIVVSFFID